MLVRKKQTAKSAHHRAIFGKERKNSREAADTLFKMMTGRSLKKKNRRTFVSPLGFDVIPLYLKRSQVGEQKYFRCMAWHNGHEVYGGLREIS
jgi:hypothetical protein